MQYQAARNVVGKGSLGRHRREVGLVGLCRLDAERHRQDKLADRGGEAGQERIEGLLVSTDSTLNTQHSTHIVARQHAVRKLQAAHDDEKGQKGIQQLRPLRRRRLVVARQVRPHAVPSRAGQQRRLGDRGRTRRRRRLRRRRGRRAGRCCCCCALLGHCAF